MRKRGIAGWLVRAAWLLAVAVSAPPEARSQCAMCGTAMASSGGFARGFTISVIFLLTTLLLVVLGFVGLVVAQARAREAGRTSARLQTDDGMLPAVEPAGGRWRLFVRRVFLL